MKVNILKPGSTELHKSLAPEDFPADEAYSQATSDLFAPVLRMARESAQRRDANIEAIREDDLLKESAKR